MEMNYCRRCASPLRNLTGKRYQCGNGHTIFANSAPAAGIFFMDGDDTVILSVRGIEPRKGMLDAFGGFADGGEQLLATALRELHEELQLTPDDYEPLRYLTVGVGHYPFEGEQLPTSAIFFWTRLKAGRQPVPSDDVAAIRSVKLHEVNLADLQDDDIRAGIRALQALFPA